MKSLHIEVRIDRAIKLCHTKHIRLRQKVKLIRHIHDLVFHFRVFINRLTVKGYRSRIRTINTADQPQKGRFSRAVASNNIEKKLEVMQAHGISGVAEWCLGMESADVWTVIADYMNK